MPKQKTNKSVAKRFPKASNDKPLRRRAGANHLLTKKSGKRKRSLRKAATLNPSDVRAIRRLAPYS